MEKSPSGKKGTCSNCRREKYLNNCGRCMSCQKAVKGLKRGTPEYAAALAEVKVRVTDPNFRPGGYCRSVAKKAVPAEQKPKSEKKAVKKFKSTKPPESMSAYDQYCRDCLNLGVKPTSMAGFKKSSGKTQTLIESEVCGYTAVSDNVIKRITVMRDYYQNKATKLTQAIELLSY